MREKNKIALQKYLSAIKKTVSKRNKLSNDFDRELLDKNEISNANKLADLSKLIEIFVEILALSIDIDLNLHAIDKITNKSYQKHKSQRATDSWIEHSSTQYSSIMALSLKNDLISVKSKKAKRNRIYKYIASNHTNIYKECKVVLDLASKDIISDKPIKINDLVINRPDNTTFKHIFNVYDCIARTNATTQLIDQFKYTIYKSKNSSDLMLLNKVQNDFYQSVLDQVKF
jgi:hypothetical protein